ncbi:MAG: MTH1187 family thiamine-binding protein [Verrucomicrobia bacterium]|nr:MTH1187 family thiamine-binding protein [Verrucomicrobiota bacterium]
MVLLEFSMFPIGKGESVSRYVARSLDIIDRSGLDYRLHAMGTVLEGEWDECMAVVKACYEAMRKDCRRVECVIKIDYRKRRRGRLQGKVASVEKRLGRKLKKA